MSEFIEQLAKTDAARKAFPERTTELVDHQIAKDVSGVIEKQYAVSPEEQNFLDYELSDPIGDDLHSPIKGVVHRHNNRVLLKLTASCTVNCRFCFRKELLVRGSETLTNGEISDALDYIDEHETINEVILTGGDPLSLNQRRLADVFDRLYHMYHIKNVRIHTRTPVVSPETINNDWILNAIDPEARNVNTPLYMVLHINHADEISYEFAQLCRKMRKMGFILLSQSVLLRGVNDNVAALQTLMERLVALGVTPYYLHHPDLVPGTAHFRVSLDKGQRIMTRLRERMSGIAVPEYVIDIPGGKFFKMPVNGETVERTLDGYILKPPGTNGYKQFYPDKAK